MARGTTFTTNHRRDGRSLVAVAFSPSRVAVMPTLAGRKIQKLLELPPIPAPSKTASQDAKRSTSRRMPAKQKRHDVVFCVNTAPRASADPGSIQDCFAGCEAQHQPADAGQAKTTRCRVLREHSSSSFRRSRLHPRLLRRMRSAAPAGGCRPRNWPRTGIRLSGRHDVVFFVKSVPRLPPRAFMGLGIIREGLPMSREPALLTSAGRMPERSQHRASEGHGWP